MSQTDSKTLGAKSPQIYQTPARDDKQPNSNTIYSSLDQHQPSESVFADCKTNEEYLQKLKTFDQRGRIELIMGTMFAGKSTELLRRLKKHEITGKRVLRVKFCADNRYGKADFITTHGGQSRDALPIETLSQLGDQWKDYDVIGIDEGQFFADIVSFAEMAANSRKVVLISSLQGTFHRGSWKNITELIPLCEKVKKLSAICKLCKESASFTFRTASANCKKMIGGSEMYMPLCRECHSRESKLNEGNLFEGDPELVDVKVEIDQATTEKKDQSTEDFSEDNTCVTSNGQASPVLKSFQSDMESDCLTTSLSNSEPSQLRQKARQESQNVMADVTNETN